MKKALQSMLHILRVVVKEKYSNVKFAEGGIDISKNSFYCDFDLGCKKIGNEDLKIIENRIKLIIKKKLKFEELEEIDIDKAIEKEKEKDQIYRVHLLKKLKRSGGKDICYCKLGNFEDLQVDQCVESTRKLNENAFKIVKLSGAYWLGDEGNKMLTRIYGVAFENKNELDKYLKIKEEAEKRDHRKLGRDLDLFHIDEKVGLGLPLWHPKGAILWRIIENFWHFEHLKNGYELVKTPHIGNKILWETSGHWNFYNDSIYPPLEAGQTLKDRQNKRIARKSEEYLIKPMNCPFHIQIYKNKPKSYRELPLRWAECGTVYRYEKKGELSGLTRTRGFTQDDAHIICKSDQVEEELKKVVDFILFIFNSFGFDKRHINVYLSLRDIDNKEKYDGNDEGWNFTEEILRKTAVEKELNFTEEKGEAAFYGPKLDFKLKDVVDREWQCSTVQFDFNLPKRFDMTFINSKGIKEKPYMIHRALFGSFERFIALLIEHFAGAFPVWLAPVQVGLISVGESHLKYCQKLENEFKNENIRTEICDSEETVGNKIRKFSKEKIPYILVVGNKEINSGFLSVRDRGKNEIRIVRKEDFISEIKEKTEQKK